MAKEACERAGKRLCQSSEWTKACRGQEDRKFPYGTEFSRGPCNVYRYFHPAHVLHGVSWRGLLDPRLNLLTIAGDAPVLRLTGASQSCASHWGEDAVMDMVGNLDEWVEEDEPRDNRGSFRGGFYARGTTSGCEADITNHAKLYYDYSTGVRCCWSK
jgi:formylglycine-generating enzyme required for sulfatase activity